MKLLTDCIPKNKFDEAAIQRLRNIEPDEWTPIIHDLIEWLQDMCWPVAHPLAEQLRRYHGKKLTDEIKTILKTQDFIWQFNVLNQLVLYDPILVQTLQCELKKLANHATADEKLDDLDRIAQEIMLKQLY